MSVRFLDDDVGPFEIQNFQSAHSPFKALLDGQREIKVVGEVNVPNGGSSYVHQRQNINRGIRLSS